jgi:hypothetical protein
MSLPRVLQDVGWIASFFGSDVEATQKVGEVEGVAIIAVTGPKLSYAAVMTAGLAERGPVGLFPHELIVTVHEQQWQAARILLEATLENVTSRDRGLVLGDVITSDEPILAGTEIAAVLAVVNPYLPEETAVRRSEEGKIITQFVTLQPLTAPEAAMLHGLDAEAREQAEERLLELLDDETVDLLDVRRSSVV